MKSRYRHNQQYNLKLMRYGYMPGLSSYQYSFYNVVFLILNDNIAIKFVGFIKYSSSIIYDFF